jgi:hypothetical protein
VGNTELMNDSIACKTRGTVMIAQEAERSLGRTCVLAATLPVTRRTGT